MELDKMNGEEIQGFGFTIREEVKALETDLEKPKEEREESQKTEEGRRKKVYIKCSREEWSQLWTHMPCYLFF